MNDQTRTSDARTLTLASLGAVLEYFDFQVYVFVSFAIGQAFFPAGASPWLTQVQTFGIYAIGYLVRPVAGIAIAHYADRIGRKKLFIFTVLLMSVPTFAMGLLPTYEQVGWVAPALLLVLRVLQGCAVGGELPGASVFVCEHASARKLGFSSGVFVGATNSGLLLGAGAAALAAQIAALDPAYSSLAWRLPFVLGGLFGLCAAYLRRHLAETPMFEEMRAAKQISRQTPLAVVMRDYRAQCLMSLGIVFVFSTTSGVFFQFLPSFLSGQLHFDKNLVLVANVVGIVAFVLAMPLWGMLRDRIGWSRTLIAGAIVGGAVATWFFSFVPQLASTDRNLIVAYAAVGVACSCAHAMVAGLISSLFPTPIRQSGFALPYSIGTAIFTGLTPLTLAWLVRDYGISAPMWQYLLACLVALVVAATVNRMPKYLGEAQNVAPHPVPIAL